ncbi:MAG TPA: hypothetical protein VK211_26525 [Kamptonema sp.]|nr:hypothetical protein [Kamptonema sp.]
MPTLQEIHSIVEQASCLLLRMVKDISKKLQGAIAKSVTLNPVKGD